MGTALGLALTGLVSDVAGGRSSVSSSVAHAFTLTGLFLAALAIAAGIIAGLRESGPSERSIHGPRGISRDGVNSNSVTRLWCCQEG